jgi:hypothetical protein
VDERYLLGLADIEAVDDSLALDSNAIALLDISKVKTSSFFITLS